jgi:hypothetical protein
MIAQKNVTHLYVVANAALATTAAPATARYLGVKRVGEVLCDATALVAGDIFQVLYYNNNSKLVASPWLKFNDIVSKNKFTPIALTSQVSDIGYNGTDGDITETSYGKYLLTIGFRDTLKQFGGKRLYKYADYTAGATAQNYDVAISIAGGINKNLSKDAFPRVIAKAMSSSTVTTSNGWASNHDATVVLGAQYITVGTNLQYASSTALAVGDYVRIGTVGGGTALTNAVYRVTELTSSTVFKVDRPITDASGTYAGATDDMEVIPKATGEASTVKWGVRLTGNDTNAPYEVGKFANNLIMFTVGVSPDFGTTDVRLTTSPVFGKGTYKEISDLDWELQGNGREKYRIAEYPVNFVSNAISTDSYHAIYVINFKDGSTDTIGGKADSLVTLMIAINSTGAESDLDTVFTL